MGKAPPVLENGRLASALIDISIEELHDQGVRGLILDFDNTLVGYGSAHIAPETAAWVRRAQHLGMRTILLSNNTTGRVRGVASELGVDAIDWALKPLPHGFRRAVRRLAVPPAQIRVIGDQLFTDVLGARFAGLQCILVEPLVAHDWAGTRLLRALERLVLPHRRRP